ncbi:MAG: flagellar biosynthesis protein FlhA, partial [Pseudomonadota bacterium]
MIKAQDLSLANIKSVLLAGDVNTVMNRYTQLMLPVLVIIILAAIVLPLPAIILDLLLVTTIAIGIVILMISLYVPNALALASFPSILLFTTMLRLSLNVASTRMILGQGFAGEVIKAFGNFVVAGNFVVGFVIFVIITIIQFVVIAKGSERVSEVAARFTLDALPGKQMSIDADLRAGLMDPDTARTKRAALGQESQFYGAMDGAMKFVKGDTMAGILISLVNLVAGLGIGVAQKGLTFGEAAKKYTLLTVGDGLVSQIPSLIMSTAAAIITTRVASAGDE